jgi:CheY-like chemotaxis protein
MAADLGKVKIDPGQIEQAIVNLVVNARDAMPSGGYLTIEIANVDLDESYCYTHLGATPGPHVLLSVSDTGMGMAPEVKERLFEPFFTTKEKGKGTGLGLSMVYGIVKQNGGHIWIYSEVGHGTTCKIYLPRVEAQTAPVMYQDELTPLPRGAETIFLVEDEPSVRNLAAISLRGQGYTVLEAQDGIEALRVAEKEGINCIGLLLTDVVMPRMGGKELADKLKSVRPELRVLFTSGYTDDAIVHHGVLDAGIAFLPKPFTRASLARKVREVLNG